jgi:hypothetical protein
MVPANAGGRASGGACRNFVPPSISVRRSPGKGNCLGDFVLVGRVGLATRREANYNAGKMGFFLIVALPLASP